jgi:hypothetical protein
MSGGDGLKSFIDVLNENGVRCRATRYEDKQDEPWIARVQEVLKIPSEDEKDNFGRARGSILKIFEGNDHIINDIENVQWVKVKNYEDFKPKLDIGDKDALACLKYALASNLSSKRIKAKVHRPTAPVNWRNRGVK